MENKDLFHIMNQIEQFWEYYPLEVIENTDVDVEVIILDENKQEEILYF